MQDVELYAFSKAGYEINISLQPQVMQQKAYIVWLLQLRIFA